jgi:iron complex transport system substrate-binding protein
MKPINFAASLILFLVILIPAVIYGSNPQQARQFKDGFGNTVTLDKPPQRIISLAPSITETIYFLGKGDKLVGVTDFCDFPFAAKAIPKIGGISNPNFERISSLKPDLILGIAQGRMKPFADKIKKSGLNIYIISVRNLEELKKSTREIAELIGVDIEVNENYKNFVSGLPTPGKLQGILRNRNTLVVLSAKPIFVSTSETIEGEIINLLGGVSPKGSFGKNYMIFGKENIIDFSPEVIIIADNKDNGYLESFFAKLPIPASKMGNIFAIDENLIMRPGPRIVDGIKLLRQCFLQAKTQKMRPSK